MLLQGLVYGMDTSVRRCSRVLDRFMANTASSGTGKRLLKRIQGLAMQPVLFIRSLPYVTAQLASYGFSFACRPVVWAALGAHGLLLLIPTVDLTSPPGEEVAETEAEEAAVIEVKDLSDLLGATAPEAAAPPPPAAAPPPVAPPPVAPPEQVVLTEVPEDLPPPSPEDNSAQDFADVVPLVDDAASKAGVAAAGTGVSNFDGAATAGRVRDLGETAPPVPFLVFENDKERYPFFFNYSGGSPYADTPLRDELTDVIVFNDFTLAENQAEILNSFRGDGVEPEEDGEYAGGPLYRLLETSNNNQVVGYLSLIQSPGGRAVSVGIWKEKPQ